MALDDALRNLEEAGRIRSQWVAGMVDESGERVLQVTPTLTVNPYAWNQFDQMLPLGDPDLADPLTVQGILLLAREAWGDPTLTTMRERLGWRVYCWPATPRGLYEGAGSYSPTEAEAIVAALVAAAEATD